MSVVWKTLFSSQFRAASRFPIVGAPMIGVSNGRWAAAVAKSGGLGFIAAGHLLAKDQQSLRDEIATFRELTNDLDQTPPLALGFIGHSATSTSKLDAWQRYEQILSDERPDVVQFFAPAVTYHPSRSSVSNVAMAQEYGAMVMAQVGNVATAREALEAGVDSLIVQGTEAGGHGLRPPLGRALLPLLADVKTLTTPPTTQSQQSSSSNDYSHVPVLAAGGLTTGRLAAAALCAGADGVVVGTRLWASEEASGHDSYKQALAASCCDDVIRTTAIDQIQNHYEAHPWPEPYDSLSVLHNKVTRKWRGEPVQAIVHASDDKATTNDGDNNATIPLLLEDALGSSSCPVASFRQAVADGDVDEGAVLTGQGVGQIHAIEDVAEIMAQFEREMVETIQGLPSRLLG